MNHFVEGTRLCVECGEILEGNVKYCSKCGSKQPEKEMPIEEETLRPKCASCNRNLEIDWFLCPHCGKKVKDDAPTQLIIPDMLENSIKSSSAAISPDGKYLAIKTTDNIIKIEDANSDELIRSIEIPYLIKTGIINCLDIQKLFISSISTNKNYIKLQICYPETTSNSANSNNNIFGMLTNTLKTLLKTYIHSIILLKLEDKKAVDSENNTLFSLEGKVFDVLIYNLDGHCLAGFCANEVILFNNNKDNEYPVFGEVESTAPAFDMIQGYITKNMLDDKDEENIVLLKFNEYQERYDWAEEVYAYFKIYPEFVITGYRTGYIHIINSKTGELLSKLQEGKGCIRWASFSSDGKRLILYNGERVNFWTKK